MNLYISSFDSMIWNENDDLMFKKLNYRQQNKCLKYKKTADRKNYLYSRILLRTYLPQYTGIHYQDIIFKREKYGKPIIEKSDIYFNLSHTMGMTVLAIASGKSVGIDVEYVRNISDTGYKIMKKCFHPEEIKYIHKKENKSFDEAFFTIWTRKEAILKRNGTGMICDMKAINTVSEENRMAIHNIFYGKYIIALCE